MALGPLGVAGTFTECPLFAKGCSMVVLPTTAGENVFVHSVQTRWIEQGDQAPDPDMSQAAMLAVCAGCNKGELHKPTAITQKILLRKSGQAIGSYRFPGLLITEPTEITEA